MVVLGSRLTVKVLAYIFCVRNLKAPDPEPAASCMSQKTYKCLAPIALPSQPGVGPPFHSPTPIVMY